MAGADIRHPTTVSEQRLLDLEREVLLSLVAERKTQERIEHTSKTGKPLAELGEAGRRDALTCSEGPSPTPSTMNIIDLGSGTPVLLIPAFRPLEVMRAAVDALSKQCRVITFSVADEPTSGVSSRSRPRRDYVHQVSDVLDARGLREAPICASRTRCIAALRRAAYRPCLRAHPDVGRIPLLWRPDRLAAFLDASA